MASYRKYLRVAGLLVSIVGPAAAPSLAAQGGRQARRATRAPSAEDAARAARAAALEPARTMLRHLVGRWRVEVRFAGNFDGPPDASGTRVVEPLFGDLRLQWTEHLDSSRTRSQGLIGFDPRTGQFYSSSVDSAGSGAEFLAGTVSLSEPLVTFMPVSASAANDSAGFAWTMIDQDHFTWAPLDRGWRAVLTRER